jgi:hypothetical protein
MGCRDHQLLGLTEAGGRRLQVFWLQGWLVSALSGKMVALMAVAAFHVASQCQAGLYPELFHFSRT